MKVKRLIEILSDFPPDAPIGLVDLTTDDEYLSSYPINDENIELTKVIVNESNLDDENLIDGVIISFENKLNENPI